MSQDQDQDKKALAQADAVLSSATLVMGGTTSGKTALLATFVEYIWATYKGVTLCYITDGGGVPPQLQALVNHGIARIWKMRTRSAPGLAFETCERASAGWWPRKINPRTGETEPNVPLIPSVMVKYTLSCPNGHVVKVGSVPGQLQGQYPCASCQVLTSTANGTVHKTAERTKGFEQVKGVTFDGATSMCSWMMDDLTERSGRGELGGEKGALGNFVSGDIAIGGSNRAMYGTIQQRIENQILRSNSIPHLAVPPVWTALINEGSDDGGMSIAGPQLSGQAKTGVAPQWFGDTLETVVHVADGKRYRRIMLQRYTDPKGVQHLCGIRSFPALLPPFLEEEEATDPREAFKTFNLGYFYQLREKARLWTQDAYAAKYPDAPGLPEGDVMEYGEPQGQVTSGPVATLGGVQPMATGPTQAAPAPGSPAARARAAKAAAPAPAPAPAPVPVPPPAPVVVQEPPAVLPPPAPPAAAPVQAPVVSGAPETPVAHVPAPVPPPQVVESVVSAGVVPKPGSPAARAKALAQATPTPQGAVPVTPAAAPAPSASPMATGPQTAVAPLPPPPPPVRAAVPPPPGRRTGGGMPKG